MTLTDNTITGNPVFLIVVLKIYQTTTITNKTNDEEKL